MAGRTSSRANPLGNFKKPLCLHGMEINASLHTSQIPSMISSSVDAVGLLRLLLGAQPACALSTFCRQLAGHLCSKYVLVPSIRVATCCKLFFMLIGEACFCTRCLAVESESGARATQGRAMCSPGNRSRGASRVSRLSDTV